MNKKKYWTGIVDVTSEELPDGIKGALYRVVTYADNYQNFVEKVTTILANFGDTVLVIEESSTLSDFLENGYIDQDHEIYEMLETATKNKQDVICGGIEYYSFDDA